MRRVGYYNNRKLASENLLCKYCRKSGTLGTRQGFGDQGVTDFCFVFEFFKRSFFGGKRKRRDEAKTRMQEVK